MAEEIIDIEIEETKEQEFKFSEDISIIYENDSGYTYAINYSNGEVIDVVESQWEIFETKDFDLWGKILSKENLDKLFNIFKSSINL